jgi:hypothetical protein
METIDTQLQIVSAILTCLLLDTIPNQWVHWIERNMPFHLAINLKVATCSGANE